MSTPRGSSIQNCVRCQRFRARRVLKAGARGPTCVDAASCERAKAKLPSYRSKKGRR